MVGCDYLLRWLRFSTALLKGGLQPYYLLAFPSRFEKISYVDVLQFLLPGKYAGTALELFVFQ